MNDCSIVVCSCDKYEDAWVPFFTLLKKNWNNCEFPIYLNTETKKYSDPLGMGIVTLNSNPNWCWSKRLKKCLKRIDSQYIIIMLEDFFLLSTVKQNVVLDCLEWIRSDDIASICFERVGEINDTKKIEHGVFVKRKRGERYTFNLQVGIWRKDILLKCLMDYESPWEFEEIGNIRSYGISEKFYVQVKDTEPVFDYNVNRETGFGLFYGKWLKSNMELFSKNNISCDFDHMGFFEDKTQFITYRRSFFGKIGYYSRNPLEIINTLVNVFRVLYKKGYWSVERLYYSKYIKSKT